MAKGGYKGSSPARETSPEEYSGVWDIVEQYGEQKAGSWPFQADDNAPKSLRFNDADSAYLSKTPVAAGNRKTWTLSFWVKLCGSSGHLISAGNDLFQFELRSDGQYLIANSGCFSNTFSTAVFRDYSAWQHFVIEHDATNTYCKVYVNGLLQKTITATNADGAFNNNTAHNFSGRSTSLDSFTDFYLAEAHFIDGQALSCEEFGFFDGQGIWQPKRFTGDYSSGPVYSNNSTGGAFHGSGSWAQAFDGKLTTGPFTYSSTSNTLTLPPGVTWKNKIRVYALRYGGVFEINGTDVTSGLTSTPAWKDLTATLGSSGTLSTIKIGDVGTNYVKLFAVELDDVILTDASVGRNSFHLDFSQDELGEAKDQSGLVNNWTAQNVGGPVKGHIADVTINAPSNVTLQSAAVQNMFDGNKDNYTYAHTNDATNYIQWTPTGGYPTNGHIWIQGGDGNGAGTNTMEVQINGSVVSRTAVVDNETYTQAAYGWGDWHKYPVSGNTLTSLRLTGAYALIRQLSTVDDPTHSVLSISNDNDVPVITDTLSSATDYFVDSPVNGKEASTGAGGQRRGNYATLNPLAFSSLSLTDGNLETSGFGSAWLSAFSTIKTPESGKWFYECTPLSGNSGIVGIFKDLPDTNTYIGDQKESYGWYGSPGVTSKGPHNTQVSYNSGATFTNNDVIGVALDLDAGTLTFYKNGTSQGVAFSGLSGSFYFAVSRYNGDMRVNFGQKPFEHPVSGFSPLATSFLPAPTIKRPDEAMDVALWTGNGISQSISDLRLSPDLVWIKNRDGGYNHVLFDTVRGTGGSKVLFSNRTTAQGGGTGEEGDTYGHVSSFNDDGFTVAQGTGTPLWVSNNGDRYVGWVWGAGDATTTIAAGGSNSLAYDQSQTWSSSLTSTQTFNLATTRAFDGNLTTLAATANDTTATILFTKTFTNVTKLRVYMDHDYQNYQVRINSGTWYTESNSIIGATANAGWRDLTALIPANGTVNSIESNTGGLNNGVNWSAVEVNGKILVDQGVTPAVNVPAVECKVRANQTTGFSIIKVDNPTSTEGRVHGLSKTPDLVICKSTASADSWHTYWKLLGKDYYINLNGTSAKASSDQFGSQEANFHSFYVKTNTGSGANKSGGMIYYAWHSVEGFSKFGEYTANNSASGPFVYCGFQPKVVLIWCHTGNETRSVYDTERSPSNFNGFYLRAGENNTEPTSNTESFAIDILSNGFKPRGQWGSINNTNTTDKYLFAAWAEHPFASNCRAR